MLYVNPAYNRSFDQASLQGKKPSEETKALREFERIFAYQFIKELRKSVPESPLFGSSTATEYFNDMLDDLWAGEMAKSGQLGIARDIQSQWRAQEAGKKGLASAQHRGGISLLPAPAGLGIPLKPPATGIPLHAGSPSDPASANTGGIPLPSTANPAWFKLHDATADNPYTAGSGTRAAQQENVP
ncbi:MAG: rod-binding protein [Candidatus Hydrogenedentes bacterium]|nr:rod-binding protein [Candidatus Hydrogenedentota bacterium]